MMEAILLIGLDGEKLQSRFKRITIHNCPDIGSAEQLLLRINPACVLVCEALAADFIELKEVMGLKIPIIVISESANARQQRLWHAYGVEEVWTSEWKQLLAQKFPEQSEQRAEKGNRKRPAHILIDDEEFEDVPPLIMPKKKKEPLSLQRTGTTVIAVASFMRRTGTTRAAIRFAQTLAAQGESVACIEVLERAERPLQVFTSLLAAGATDAKDDRAFILERVHFYPNLTLDAAIEVVGEGFSYVVFDLGPVLREGCSSPFHRLMFSRSDLSFVTIGAAPWDLAALEGWQRSQTKRRTLLQVLVQMADEAVFNKILESVPKSIQAELGLSLNRLPYDPDITCSKKLNQSVYAELLKSISDKNILGRFSLFRRTQPL